MSLTSAPTERPQVEIAEGREFAFTAEDFRQIADLVHTSTGIRMPQYKSAMVYSRLAKRLRALGLDSFREYCRLVLDNKGLDERQKMLAQVRRQEELNRALKAQFDALVKQSQMLREVAEQRLREMLGEEEAVIAEQFKNEQPLNRWLAAQVAGRKWLHLEKELIELLTDPAPPVRAGPLCPVDAPEPPAPAAPPFVPLPPLETTPAPVPRSPEPPLPPLCACTVQMIP